MQRVVTMKVLVLIALLVSMASAASIHSDQHLSRRLERTQLYEIGSKYAHRSVPSLSGVTTQTSATDDDDDEEEDDGSSDGDTLDTHSQNDSGTKKEGGHKGSQRTLLDSVRASDGTVVPIVSGVNGDPGVYPGSASAFIDGWRLLPNVTGATIDLTTIKVGTGGATLAHYITSSYDATKIKRAVIIVHGDNRVAWNEFIYAKASLQRAVQGGDVKEDEVVIMAPQFFNDVDHGAYPADPVTNASTSSVMIWSDNLNNWGDGSPSIFPANSDVGAFDALDATLTFFHDKTRFPNLVNVVVGGFSMGGQLVQRYSVLRPTVSSDDESRTQYWVSSPASFVYLNSSRPESIKSKCTGFNNYKYGLEGTLPLYLSDQGSGSPSKQGVALTQAGLGPRYVARKLNFLVGLKDHIAGDSRCQADTQGRNHVTKLNNWITTVMPYLAASSGGKLPANSTVDYVKNVGHQDYRMIPSDPGVQRLFLDDYASVGSSAAAPPSNGDTSSPVPSSSDLNGDKTDGDGPSQFRLAGRFIWTISGLVVVALVFL